MAQTDNPSSCAWPAMASSNLKNRIESFYHLLNGSSEEDGKAWSEHFTPDGEMVAFGQVYNGRAAIADYITTFWKSSPDIKYTPVKALFHDEDGKEIIVITQFEATMQDGTVVADETAAYYTMEDIDGQILVSRLKVYMDPQPLMKAMSIPGI